VEADRWGKQKDPYGWMAEKGNFLLLSPRLSFHRASAVDKRGGPGRQGELVESRLPVSALSSWKSDRADLNELETLSEVVEPSSLEKSQREMSSTVHLAALLLLLQGLGVLGIPPYELYGGYPSQGQNFSSTLTFFPIFV